VGWKASDGHSAANDGRRQVGWIGVDVLKTGTQITVKHVSENDVFMNVQVSPAS
jgi:hypothetical protein